MPPQRNAGTGSEAEHPRYAGQYRLEERLGSGGMGVVHLARSASGLRLAVKVVHAQFAQDPEFRGRFRQEVAAARRVSGAFTAPVVDADPEAENPWMATLFIPGATLADHVKRNGALPEAQLRQLMAGLAEALRDIHRVGVVHRDLKPSNVLLADDGPKVIDFGISRPSDSELRTETGKLIGTPPFMAPEQFSRPREVGPAADVFALGSVIVHAATGSGPFDSDSPYLVAYQVVHHEPDLTGVPEELTGIVTRCLAKEPEDRPTPDEVMSALRGVSASYDTQTFQTFVPEQRGSEASRSSEGFEQQSTPGPSVGTDPPRQPDAAGPAPKKSRAGRLWAAVAAVLVAGSGFAAANLGGSDLRPTTRPKTPVFSPWSTSLGAGAKATSMHQCIYALDKVYCTGSGLLATEVDPATGKVLWSRPAASSAPDAAPPVPPVLSGGLLHIVSAADMRLSALDPATGATRWSRDITRYRGRYEFTADTLLLTGPDSTVTALDSATGKVRWSHPIQGQPQPAFFWYGGGQVYAASPVGQGTRLTVVNPKTGTAGRQHTFATALAPTAAHDGTVWLQSIDLYQATDAVVRYDPATDTERRIPLPYALPSARAVVYGDIAYVMASGGALVALDTERATPLWRTETSVSTASVPALAGGRLYLTAGDGRLLAIGAKDGALLGQTKPRLGSNRATVPGSLPMPVVVNGKVYATARDGTLFALDARHPEDW